MFPVMFPFGTSVVLAILSDLTHDRQPNRRKSIEMCTADCKASWLKEDGVLRVYNSTDHMNCVQIVVEVDGEAPMHIPGSVQEHPVRLRLVPPQTSFGASDTDAAEKFLAMAEAHNRKVIPKSGQSIRQDGPGRSKIVLSGPALTKREDMYLRYVGERFEVQPFVSVQPPPVNLAGEPTGESTVHISFTKH